ncbi:MAG: ATP-binding protein, partial [Promethearchaeota archaeon]
QSIFVSGFDFELTDHFVKSMPFILARIPLTLYLQPNLELRSQVSYFENISTFILGILLGVIIGIFILLLERNFKKINQDMIEKSQMEQIIFRKQKFESLGTLAGGIAHDFNNILSGIQGNMELTIFDLDELTEKIKINPEFLQNIGDLVKDSKENLHEIQELIQHSIEINRQITDFSSGSHSNIGLFNVRDILNFSINSFSNMIDKRIKIDKNYFGLNPYIICDSSQFKQVILNILINARDAMVGRDGKIEISIATQKREHSLKLPQKIQTFVKNNKCELDHTLNLIISIKDSGEGIPPENLEKIFDPFFTTKRGEKHGSGLGLAIVYKIIHSAGGDIIVNSTMGEGTTFCLILPYISHSGEVQVSISSFSEKKSQKFINCPNLKVLVIEDEKIIRKNLQKYLEAGKVFIFSLDNGKKGWQFYQEHYNEIDLVILDINLPGMNGIDIYQHIKGINPKQPTLFMTGYSAYDFPVFDKYDLGLLEKPFKFDELGHKILEFYDSFKKSE